MRFVPSLLFLFLMLFASCEKPLMNEADDQDDKKEQSNLTVSIFQIEQTPFSEFTRSQQDMPTRISYAAYDMEGQRVKQINQKSGDADYGQARFLLPPGTYQLVVVAHSSNGNPTMTNLGKIQFTNAQGYTDTFLAVDTVEVTTQSQTLEVSPRRIVSLCRFVVTDAYPQNVAKLHFLYTGGSGAFDAHTGLGSVNSSQAMEVEVTKGRKEFDLYTFLHSEEGTIDLQVTAIDKNGIIAHQRQFQVPMAQRQITRFSGPFFGGNGGGGTTDESLSVGITINTQWEGEYHYTFQ